MQFYFNLDGDSNEFTILHFVVRALFLVKVNILGQKSMVYRGLSRWFFWAALDASSNVQEKGTGAVLRKTRHVHETLTAIFSLLPILLLNFGALNISGRYIPQLIHWIMFKLSFITALKTK